MRRIRKVKPLELSLTPEAANRRIFTHYKSRHKPGAAGPQREPSMDLNQLEQQLSNTPVEVYQALEGLLAKSTKESVGQGFSPQCASVMKAVARLVSPFTDQMTLGDLAQIGKAAGLSDKRAQQEDASIAKAVPKSDAEEDEEGDDDIDEDEDDAADEDEGDDAEADAEDDEDDEEDDEDEDEDATNSKGKPVSKSADPKFVPKDKTEETDELDADEEKSAAAAKLNGKRAKGEKMSKSASAEPSDFQELKKSFARLVQASEAAEARAKASEETLAKTRRDFEEERGFRQLEALKKSVREDFSHLNVDAEKIAPMLKSLRAAVEPDMYDQFVGVLKSADLQVKGAQYSGGLFKSSSTYSRDASNASAEDTIEARVDAIMAKSANGKIRPQIYDDYIQTPEGRELLVKARTERGY